MGSCITPYTVRKSRTDNTTIPVPCGKCPPCITRRVSGWSFRLMQEDKISIESYFITLTYDTANVPITRSGYMEISKRDVQLFFKRLRKSHDSKSENYRPIRYYAVGEYGGRTNRPHYHAIIFNAKLELIQPAWNMGDVHYGTVSGASVGYTLKYMSKEHRIPMHKNDDRQPEFALMSKGLGENYLTPQMIRWHHADLRERMYCTLDDGKKVSMPRYYKNKLFTPLDKKIVAHFSHIKHIKQEVKNELEQGILYHRNKAEAHKASFARMYKKSLENLSI